MFSWRFIPWLLQIPNLTCAFEFSKCFYIPKDFSHDGDVMIGAFFPVYYYFTLKKVPHKILPYHYEDFYIQYKFKNYQFVLALVFAIEQINRNMNILPNTSLGFDIYNIPFSEKTILLNAFIWLSGINTNVNYNCKGEKKSVAALTGTSFAVSAQMATLLQLYKVPQLTFGSFDTILSDRAMFTSLYQMAPNDTFLPLGIVSLMLHFNWTWVGLLITDDHRGIQSLSDLIGEMAKNKICLAFVEMILGTWALLSTKFWKSLEKIRDSSANVIIIYGDTDSLQGTMKHIGQELTTWKVWVTNSQWDATSHEDYFMLDSFHGSLIFSHHYEEMINFTNFIHSVNPSKYPEDTYLPIFWHLFFKCPLSEIDCKPMKNCHHNASLNLLPKHYFDTAMSEESYYIYNAVYAVAHGVHDMILKQLKIQEYKNGEEIPLFPWQLHPFLQNIYIDNHVGSHMLMDFKYNLDFKYDIMNFWNFPKGFGLKVKVGSFSPNAPHGQQLTLSEHLIQWPSKFTEYPKSVCNNLCGPGFRKTALEGRAACCFDCTSCPDNEISNETDMDHCLKCPDSHYANIEKNQCLKKTVTFLHYEDPLGMTLSSLALCFSAITAMVLVVFVKHQDTPIVKANNRALSYILLITLIICFLSSLLLIGQPNKATCIMQQITFGIVFTVALSTVLAKALTVVIAFRVMFPGRLMRWLMISRATNYIIPIFTLLQIIFSGIWLGTSPPFVDIDVHTQHGYIILVCNKGSVIAFHCVLGYHFSLALGSYIMAFLSRNLPDKFNEAKFLTFSMLVVFTVWVTFLPVYHSTKGKVMVAMEVLSILASSAAFLGFIFVPKCYIILLNTNKNVFHGIRDNTHCRRNSHN